MRWLKYLVKQFFGGYVKRGVFFIRELKPDLNTHSIRVNPFT